MMCLSKGLTGGFLAMGATVTTERVHDAFSGDAANRAFWHGHSYTGNPLAAAAGVASLEIFRTEPVFERITAIAGTHAERLARVAGLEQVGETRQIGTMAAIELKAGDAGYLSSMRPKLYGYFLERGILLRPLGNVIYLLPPYCTPMDELHRAYDSIEEGIRALVPLPS